MKWKEIPSGAKHYIVYHTMISPFLVVWYMLPVYMFRMGYSVFEVGAIFTLVNLISIPLTYMIGKMFDRVSVRTGLVLVDVLDGIENILYGLSAFFGKSLIPIGMIFGKVAHLFYPLYQVAERILYPEGKLEEIFSWHMRLPLLSESIGMIVFGYVFGRIFTKVEHYALGFIAAGGFSAISVLYLLKFLPSMGVEERKMDTFRFKFDREFGYIILIEVLDIFSTNLAPNLVLLYYLTDSLKMNFFDAMIIVSAAHLSTLPATFISERIEASRKFEMISLYFVSKILWALFILVPKFFTILIANVVIEFGDTLSFPFYRSWLFRKVPKDRAGEILSAVSSMRKLVNLFSPILAGFLASIDPRVPYILSVGISTVSLSMVIYFKRVLKTDGRSRC